MNFILLKNRQGMTRMNEGQVRMMMIKGGRSQLTFHFTLFVRQCVKVNMLMTMTTSAVKIMIIC